jgi:hypothetical protein
MRQRQSALSWLNVFQVIVLAIVQFTAIAVIHRHNATIGVAAFRGEAVAVIA